MRMPFYFLVKSMILPVTMIYFETIAILMHDISHGSQPLRALFVKSNKVHQYSTRSAAKGNCFQKDAKLEIQKRSFSRGISFYQYYYYYHYYIIFITIILFFSQ